MILANRQYIYDLPPQRVKDTDEKQRTLRRNVALMPRITTPIVSRWEQDYLCGPVREYPDVNSVVSALAYIATYAYRNATDEVARFNVDAFQEKAYAAAKAQKLECRHGVELYETEGFGLHGRSWEDTAHLARPRSALRLYSVEELEHAVRYLGPCLLGIDWYPGWITDIRERRHGTTLNIPDFPTKEDEDGNVEEVDAPMGGFAVCVTGFDFDRRRFNIRFPLGMKFGNRGHGFIDYREVTRQLRKAPDAGADAFAFEF